MQDKIYLAMSIIRGIFEENLNILELNYLYNKDSGETKFTNSYVFIIFFNMFRQSLPYKDWIIVKL